jgi:hypothetical protein
MPSPAGWRAAKNQGVLVAIRASLRVLQRVDAALSVQNAKRKRGIAGTLVADLLQPDTGAARSDECENT